ncbi:MAG: tyrosine-type recombinase/integrase [Boseongicola sp. SB0677_bin_26]|nr:tyrosine-type recombinase/integrase [Boseongicola sp. SB0665_bin_10]MYG28321.1 tyrosine-type recombinase/integrase [Boseongicola sp. SB0677_bin_26]
MKRFDHLTPTVKTGENAVAANVSERLEAAIRDSKSANTVRAYRASWRKWEEWSAAHGARVMPARPEAVALFVAERAEEGKSVASLRLAVAAIAAAHDAAGHANPCADRVVKTAMQGLVRQAAQAGASQKQAAALTAEAVEAIRGALNGAADGNPKVARDIAIVSLLACTGLRRSEAAALDWSQVGTEADGSGRLTVTRSKTDQEGDGAVVAVSRLAMRDLERWAELQGRDRQGPVFGLSGRQVSRRVAACAKAAGLGDGFSGHSGRVGMAITMLRNQAASATIMRQGRWNSERMISRYGRNETAGEALRYL